MPPIRITTDNLAAFILEDFPRIHAELVPSSATGAYSIDVELRGEGSFAVEIDGTKLAVSRGRTKKPHAWISVEARAAEEFFKAFWKSGRAGTSPPVLLSDPRLLKNLCMGSATLALTLRDFRTSSGTVAPLTVRAAVGSAAAKKTPDDPADFEIHASEATLMKLADGAMAPEDALGDGDVSLTGKRLAAMQLALAFAPFFTKK